jgi:hypothetical protein
MSAGETAFLALVIGSFVVFAVAMVWLRHDYVRFLGRSGGQAGKASDRLQAQMAE